MNRQDNKGFGWKANCPKHKLAEIRAVLADVEQELAMIVGSTFPTKEGYQVACSTFVGALEGFRVQVERGDFRAEIDLEVGTRALQSNQFQPPKPVIEVHMSGHGGSVRLTRVQRRSGEIIQHVRLWGGAMGGLALVLLLISFLRSPPTQYVEMATLVGGLLLVILFLITLASATTAGTWIGERMAENIRARTLILVAQDRHLNQDLQRWYKLERKLVGIKDLFLQRVQSQPSRRTMVGVAVQRR